MRLVPRSRRTSRGRGERLAGRGGASTDLADYRDYAAGDDLRAVDWHAFARLQKPYLRLFRLEEDRHLVILVDTSASMRSGNKLARARSLAAAFACLGLASGDRVSLWSFGGGGDARRLAPVRGLAQMPRATAACAAIAPAEGGDAALTPPQAVSRMLARHLGRGACVVISDFTHADDLRPSLNRLHAAGLEPMGVQVLSRDELDPDFGGDARLVDAETGDALDVSFAAGALDLYLAALQRQRQELAAGFAGRGGRFAACSDDEDLRAIFLDRLRRQGWLT